jgi:nucleotide-binding universal stress UspA family protein
MPMIGDKPDLSLETVVYATDFSLGSQNAGLYAALVAAYFSATLLVAHAFTLSQAASEAEIEGGLLSQQRKDLKALLSSKAVLLQTSTVEAIPTLLEGDPKDVIPELAERNAPSMIVLGTHGGRWLEREVIGSVAERILRSSRWPSLTVGPEVKPVSSKTLLFERVLFATVKFAEAFGARIDVLNVVPEDAINYPDRLAHLQSQFYRALDELVPEQAKEFCEPRTYVEMGNAHNRILEHIREHSVDLLVLGIRKTSHLDLETRTSQAFQIIVNAECPVLTIRA